MHRVSQMTPQLFIATVGSYVYLFVLENLYLALALKIAQGMPLELIASIWFSYICN